MATLDELAPRLDRERATRQISDFLGILAGESSGSLSLQSGFRVGPRLHGVSEVDFEWPTAKFEVLDWVLRETSYGRDVYVDPVIDPDSVGVVWVDLNRGEIQGLPEPTLTVESSRGRRQCYWLLHDVISRVEARRLSQVVAQHCGDDAQVGRYMRIPGTHNYKYLETSVQLSRATGKVYSATLFSSLRGSEVHLDRQVAKPIWRRGWVQAGLSAAAGLALIISLSEVPVQSDDGPIVGPSQLAVPVVPEAPDSAPLDGSDVASGEFVAETEVLPPSLAPSLASASEIDAAIPEGSAAEAEPAEEKLSHDAQDGRTTSAQKDITVTFKESWTQVVGTTER